VPEDPTALAAAVEDFVRAEQELRALSERAAELSSTNAGLQASATSVEAASRSVGDAAAALHRLTDEVREVARNVSAATAAVRAVDTRQLQRQLEEQRTTVSRLQALVLLNALMAAAVLIGTFARPV